MINFSTAINAAKKYTSNGARLLSRQTGLKAKALGDIALPKGALTMDVVQIESHFGDGLKTVVKYKDKDGKLLKHVRKEYRDNALVGKMVRDYERYGAIQRINTTKYNGNGKILENINEAISVRWGETDSVGRILHTKPHAIRTKLSTKPLQNGARSEFQTIEHLHTCGQREYIQTEATRYRDGTVIKKGGKGNLPNTRELGQDPYLFIRNYSNSDFAESALHIAQKDQLVAHREIEKIIEPIERKTTLGYATFGGKVVIDADKAVTKQDLVDTINHEMRHQYQFDQIDKLGFFRSLFSGKKLTSLSCEEQEIAKKYLKARIFYCPPIINKKLYRKNFLEVDARKAGHEAVQKFEDYSKKLAESFRATNEQYPLFQAEYLAMKECIAAQIKDAPKVGIKNLKIKDLD